MPLAVAYWTVTGCALAAESETVKVSGVVVTALPVPETACGLPSVMERSPTVMPGVGVGMGMGIVP